MASTATDTLAAWHAVHIDSYSPFVSTPFLAAAWIDPTGVTTQDPLLESHAVTIRGTRDHVVSQSIYCEDPDGNTVELYVDGDPAIWAEDPTTVATTKPLVLS